MLQYGGVDLLMPDAAGWLDDYLQRTDLARLDLFGASPVALCDQRTNAVGNHQPVTPFPLPNYHAPPQLEINQLYWPSGAARWSTFIGLVDSDGLDKIRGKLTTETSLGSPAHLMTPLPFAMADTDFQGPITPSVPIDTDGRMSVQTNLYMLEPRAISTVQGRDTLWLLPLVDVRYFWQYRQMPHRVPSSLLTGRVTETSLKTSWHGWLSLVQHALDPRPAATRDVTLEFLPDDIPDEYFFPDRSEFDHSQHNAAVVLDALAHSCGRRFVRQYNGDCELIDVTESHKRHAAQLVDNSGGGIAILTQTAADKIDATAIGQKNYAKMAVYPQFVDVGFRKLVEYDLDDVPDDEPAGTLPAPFNVTTAVLAGPGTRTVRNDTRISGARSIVEYTSKIIHTPSWVGRHLWHDGTGTCPEPPGLIDDKFYGDRYFRLAKQITDDYVDWLSQQHEYDYPGFQPRTLSGFDDFIIWDHQRGSTHLKSHSNDFGVATQLVQVHRQCSFDREQVVGVVSSAWTLYPEGGESCVLEIETDETPTTDTLPGTIEDVFDYTWQWAEAFVRPFIPTDPWAATDSIQYGRTMVWAAEEIVAVTRSQSIIADLLDRVPDPDSVLGATADDRIVATPNAAGVAYLRRYGCEWQVIWVDCDT